MLSVTLDNPGQFSFSTTAAVPSPGPGESLVKVHRIGVCGTDIHAYHGRQPFFNYPRVLGHELGVEIVEINGDAHGLKIGDKCSVEPYVNDPSSQASRHGKPNACENICVLGVHGDGGMREQFIVPTRKLHKSDKLNFDQLALIETLCIGAHGVERAAPTKGDFALVIGAGPIGLSVLQFAMVEAGTCAIMDISDERLGFCKDTLGVKHTVNPMNGSAEEALRKIGNGDLPSVIIDATGNPKSMASCFELAAHGCRIVFVGLFQGELAFNDPNFHKREITLMASRNALPETFSKVIKLVEDGVIDTTPWITHRLTLAEVPEKFAPTIDSKGLLKAMIEVA